MEPYIIGEYNAMEYRVMLYDDEHPMGDEVYSACNSPFDSQVMVPAERGVGLEKMKEYCEQSSKEIAQEKGVKFSGLDKLEDDFSELYEQLN